MAEKSFEGGCFCGAVRFRADGTPFTTHCHCRACSRAAGAPFVTWTEFAKSAFRWTRGTPAVWTSTADDGSEAERGFCGRCGTLLFYLNRRDADVVNVSAVSLDEPERVRPHDHIWCDGQLGWIELGDGLPRHGKVRQS